MLKKAVVMSLAVGIGLAALHGGTADAGWTYVRPPGTWWWYGSIHGCGTVTQIRNPEQFPAKLSCEIAVTRVETLCKNPAGQEVPGEAATQVIFFVDDNIESSDLLNDKSRKLKSSADLCVAVEDDKCPGSPLCDPAYCVNPNWEPIDVLTTAFRATCSTQTCSTRTVVNGECVDAEGNEAAWVQQDTQVCECTLPAGWDVRNKPPTCEDPLGVGCEPFDCFRVMNGVTTTERCSLQ